MVEIVAAVGGAMLVALFIGASLRYFKRSGDGRAEAVMDPSWTSDMATGQPAAAPIG